MEPKKVLGRNKVSLFISVLNKNMGVESYLKIVLEFC